jgi:UPF0755 protein
MDKNIENIKIIVKIAKIIIPILIVIFVGWSIFTIIEKNKKIEELQILKDNQPVVEKIADDYNLIKEAKEEKVEPSALEPKKETIVTPAEPPLPEGTDRFIVSLNSTNDTIAASLLESEYIKDKDVFKSILSKNTKNIVPGAYKISKEMTEEQLNKVLTGQPYMKWIVIKPGLRKEEIAEILASNLRWSKLEKDNWINKDTVTSPEYTEGVYYPDTYLIPVEEEPALVAKRLINKFNENFSGYLGQFTSKNIKWARALTLASIVQREASNNSDMPLIAGILWNRLEQNMALGVDATLQYLRGDKGSGWWAPISVADKQIDSPFNTYKYKGLPPHPISNPGIMAIEAVLNPIETDCLYYIHDKERKTHCAVTYEEHKSNIQKYLIDNN